MFVSDLKHFLDMPDHAPGPARRLGEQLSLIVRAATAGPGGARWVSAVRCRRRPGHRPCPGHLAVFRLDATAPIRWSCPDCGDEGTISGWEDSPFDLRRVRPVLASVTHAVVVSEDTVTALQGLMLTDPDCERQIFQTRCAGTDLVLPISEDDLEELLGSVAAEANHETNLRRQKRLDAAVNELEQALQDLDP